MDVTLGLIIRNFRNFHPILEPKICPPSVLSTYLRYDQIMSDKVITWHCNHWDCMISWKYFPSNFTSVSNYRMWGHRTNPSVFLLNLCNTRHRCTSLLGSGSNCDLLFLFQRTYVEILSTISSDCWRWWWNYLFILLLSSWVTRENFRLSKSCYTVAVSVPYKIQSGLYTYRSLWNILQ